MTNFAIKVENLSKYYRLGEGSTRSSYRSFREDLTNLFSIPFAFSNKKNKTEQYIWALKNVSFEIKHGDAVGIIGRNGAGKTTLLKILSRISEPTKGKAIIYGRIGSLLEVGTGFHPELTGRDNIFLNGAIIGMKKSEIKKKFDEIVDFAEIEKFLDTPVKRYSSGMYVRLAFAVAAHLEPEILLIDEVLAVGDAIFQKKCLGKMGDVAKEGRTVLFVSHNMQAIRQLCKRAILFDHGEIILDNYVSDVIDKYLKEDMLIDNLKNIETLIKQLPIDSSLRLKNIILKQNNYQIKDLILNGDPLEIEIHYQVLERKTGLRVFIDLLDMEETLLFRSFHDGLNDGIPIMESGNYISSVIIPADFLSPMSYDLRVLATVYNEKMCIPYPGIRIPLNVQRTGSVNRAYLVEPIRGKIAPILKWKTIQI